MRTRCDKAISSSRFPLEDKYSGKSVNLHYRFLQICDNFLPKYSLRKKSQSNLNGPHRSGSANDERKDTGETRRAAKMYHIDTVTDDTYCYIGNRKGLA